MTHVHALLIALGLTGCTPIVVGDRNTGSSSALTGGSDASGRTNAVLLAITTDTTWAYCGSTLIAPDLLLTAAHCVHPAYAGQNAKITAQLDGQPYDSNLGRVVTGQATYDPLFVPTIGGNGLPTQDPRLGHDVAVVKLGYDLAHYIPGVRPATLYTAGDDSTAFPSLATTLVGFIDAKSNVGPRDAITMTADHTDDAGIYLDSTPDGGGLCHGDSGGPTFATVGGTEYLIGVINAKVGSHADACSSSGAYSARVDANLDFINQFLPAPATADDTDPTAGDPTAGDPPEDG